jgi:[ribosomal protein S5]-alanine N-acetyltransferase
VEQSRQRLARWNPVDPDDLANALSLQSRGRRTFLIHALAPEGDHDIVGKVNVSDVVRGRFESAAMGYDCYDPYAGRGLFAAGLRLILNVLFAPEVAGGVGLHRVQAAVQPGNVRSAGLLRSLGFQREGFSPRMLWLPDANGNDAWRDHDSYAMLRDEWPAQPYRQTHRRKVVALVNGAVDSGATALARGLAAELGVPLFFKDDMRGGDGVRGAGPDPWWLLLADSPVGGVVTGRFGPQDAHSVAEGLRRAGVNPEAVPEISCPAAQDTVSDRKVVSERNVVSDRSAVSWRPLGLGPAVVAGMGQRGYPEDEASRADVVRIALLVRQGLPPASET